MAKKIKLESIGSSVGLISVPSGSGFGCAKVATENRIIIVGKINDCLQDLLIQNYTIKLCYNSPKRQNNSPIRPKVLFCFNFL